MTARDRPGNDSFSNSFKYSWRKLFPGDLPSFIIEIMLVRLAGWGTKLNSASNEIVMWTDTNIAARKDSAATLLTGISFKIPPKDSKQEC